MKKRTIATFLILSIVFYAIYALITFYASTDTLVAIGNVFALFGAVTGLIALVGGLVKQARRHQWIWFVCTILFGITCLVLYLLVVPESPAYRMYQPKQDYQPQPQRESAYYYQPRPYQATEQRDPPRVYQERVQPESYEEATRPEFYQEQRVSETSEEWEH